jgi:hypothetical protein
VIGISTIASLAEADTLITDAGLHRDAHSVLTEHVTDVLVAPLDVPAPPRTA